MLASLLAHAVAVGLLALVTLRLPSPPASVALEIVPREVAVATLEVSQELELPSLEEVAEPPPVVEQLEMHHSLQAVAGGIEAAPIAGQTLPGVAAAGGLELAAANFSALAGSSVDWSATFFGAAASGNCFCYVIDGSASMRNGPWEAAKAELLRSLAGLKPKQRFYIIFFNRQLSALPLPGQQQPAPHALYATPENLLHARQWLETLQIEYGAPPLEALELAIAKEPDAIYLLTDGATQADVVAFLRQCNRVVDVIGGEQVRVPIHCIAFYSLEGQDLLRSIAADNRGQYVYVPDPRPPKIRGR